MKKKVLIAILIIIVIAIAVVGYFVFSDMMQEDKQNYLNYNNL